MSEEIVEYNAEDKFALNTVTPSVWGMLYEIAKATNTHPLKILYCYEMGLKISAAANLYVVNGRIATEYPLTLQLIRRHPDYDYEITEIGNEKCTVVILRRGEDGEFAKSGSVTWTIDDAKRAGLANKDVWKKYPESMLLGKAVARAQRRYVPDLSVPTYTSEEVDYYESAQPDKVIVEDKVDWAELAEDYTPEELLGIRKAINKGHNLKWAIEDIHQKRLEENEQAQDGEYRDVTIDDLLADAEKEGISKSDIMKVNNGEMPTTPDEMAIAIESLK
ncbi:MAG: hypothetical protein GF411_13240 [Candidatus Lokiarchaeota archaeon]|nr:hypothetical protein [Candidatus Lokiarchaeota archaeon]